MSASTCSQAAFVVQRRLMFKADYRVTRVKAANATDPNNDEWRVPNLNRSLAERTRRTASGREREVTTSSRVGSFVGALTVSRKVATRAEAGPGAPPSTSASTNRMASSTSVGTLKIFGRLASRRKLGQHHRHQHECRSGLNAGKGRL